MSTGKHKRSLKKTRSKLKLRGFLKNLKKNRFHLLSLLTLLLITSLLCFLNYEPNTWLTGWDNLHPEFNFLLNLKRSLFSVWQEYQSLGLLGGMAHAADLPHQLFLFLFSLFIPSHFLRYLWTFLMLFLGPLGTYFFIKNHFLTTPKKPLPIFKNIPFLKTSLPITFDSATKVFASLLGALFYLLNLSTIQTFYTPFETFTSFYAFLPWILYFLISYLKNPTSKNLFIFFLISLFSSPSFYVETLFIVLLLTLLPFLTHFFKSNRTTTTRSVVTLILTQSYWLLPVIFFIFTNGHVGEQAKNNLIASPETYARNLQFANLLDTGLLKGYLFNFLDITQNQQYDYLLLPWRQHLQNPLIILLGFFNLSLILTGIYYSIKKGFSLALPLVLSTITCIFFLLGGNLFLNFIPFIGELFRSPFTKFSLPLSFCFSVFFSIGTIFIFDIFSFLNNRLTYITTTFTLSLFLLIYSSPAFSGHLISPSMRQSPPQEYTELFDFFKQQDPTTRIANFPQYTFWGWNYYSWGYRGSGFLWYGIQQPILDRAFDVWEKSSQDYYEDISTALYSQDQQLFEKLTQQYSVDWILIDKYITPPSSSTDSYTDKLISILNSSDYFEIEKNFNDMILVYKTKNQDRTQNFLSLTAPSTSPNQPLEQLSLRPNTDWKRNSSSISLTTPLLLSNTKNINLHIPSYTTQENLLPVSISYRKTPSQLILQLQPLLPKIELDHKTIDYSIKPTTLFFNISPLNNDLILQVNNQFHELHLPGELNSQPTFYPLINAYLPTQKSISFQLYSATPDQNYNFTQTFQQAHPYQCYTQNPNRSIEKITTQNSISLLGTDVVGCLSTPLPLLPSGLISTTYTYYSSTNTPANTSITNTDLDSTTTPPQPQKTQSLPTSTRQFSFLSPESQQLNLILEANETNSIAEITYQDIYLHHHPLIDSVTISLPEINTQTVPLSSLPQQLTISLPSPSTNLSLTSLTNLSLTPQARNCDNFNSGIFSKEPSPIGILYSAQDSISCDSFNLRQLPHTTSYLLTLDLQHQQGLLPTICLENHSTRHCDIFERLLDTDSSQSVIQPISNPQESSGYTLHLFNQSFGQRSTQNLLKSISAVPLPLNFLKQISFASNDQSSPPTPLPFSSSHPAEFIYLFSSDQQQDTILNLHQTYSPHWLAIPVSSSYLDQPLYQKILTLPFQLLKDKPLTHTKTSWHSSWNLSDQNQNIIIFYWPQYLQFIGFILLPLPLLFFIKRKKSKHNS